MTLKEMFDRCEGEYLKFSRVEKKRSGRPDLHAFLLLDELCPSESDMVESATHDEFYLSPSVDKLEKVITQDQVIELVRCGVRYDSNYECLCMFA